MHVPCTFAPPVTSWMSLARATRAAAEIGHECHATPASTSPTLVVVNDDALLESRCRHDFDATFAVDPARHASGLLAFTSAQTERRAKRS